MGDSWVQFKAQYYIFALVFLVFDVETVFLFPWAVKLAGLGVRCYGRYCLYPDLRSPDSSTPGAKGCWNGRNSAINLEKADGIFPFSLFFV